ncbi:LysR family transcriptional regulator [Pseudomonas sp. PB120]|uniref:LysR family transcriptional regulator n=1 Tax=Pseudomonas sp. PB120 TaxID=2494700 RepID=UPI0012FDE01F|nr:LysR family transcriptional regulator [Pseudomonas sp. PB120]MVV51772.1 LysR family transcriptional regulator [Pseudomonas sp. PB120]
MNDLENLSTLKIFSCAAQTRSFTEAGNQLGISASAVGKAVARLEQRLGVRLFHRSTRSIQLTEEGQQVLDGSQRIFNELETIEAGLAQNRGAPRGKLRVSLPLTGLLMMPTLTAFMQAYPEVELDLHFSDHLVDIVNEGFDVVVRAGEASDSRLIARNLGNYQLKLVGSPAYFKRAGIPLKPADLVDHSCLHHRFPSNGKLERWPLRADLEGDEVVVPVTTISSTVEPLIALAEAGMGIVCIPDLACRRQLADGTLVEVLAEYVEHSGTFRAVWPASPYRSPKLRVFVDFMATHLLAESDGARQPASLNITPMRRSA